MIQHSGISLIPCLTPLVAAISMAVLIKSARKAEASMDDTKTDGPKCGALAVEKAETIVADSKQKKLFQLNRIARVTGG